MTKLVDCNLYKLVKYLYNKNSKIYLYVKIN